MKSLGCGRMLSDLAAMPVMLALVAVVMVPYLAGEAKQSAQSHG